MQQRVLFAPRQPSPPGPDVGGDLPRYREWAAERAALRAEVPPSAVPHAGGDRLDLLAVLDHPRADALERCLRSVQAQTCGDWHLTVVVPDDTDRATRRLVAGVLRRMRWRATVVAAAGHRGAAEAQLAFEHSAAPLVCLLDRHDLLTPDAVALLLHGADGADMVYGDEDALDEHGQLTSPVLKPDWSPELLGSGPYLGRPLAVRRELLQAVGGFRSGTAGDWEHDFMLRIAARASVVAHVAEVLVHRGGSTQISTRTVPAPLSRTTEAGATPGTLPRPARPSDPPSVSVIVPFRDEPRFLRTCVDSVTATAGPIPLELLLVDNGSVEPETQTLVERLADRPDVTVLRDDRPFNWAALNNTAVSQARADMLLFLNNDIEVQGEGWLEALVRQGQRLEVGVVGARLLYPGGSVQHAGMVLGLGGAAGHVLVGLPGDEPGYLGMATRCREVSAVTGACLLTRRRVFEELGGFDESLGLDLNDVDFCLRAGRLGYRVLYEPAAELVHHESPSRGTSGSASDIRRFVERWEQVLLDGDPYLSPHLSRIHSSCSLGGPDEGRWWQEWRSTLPTS